LHLLKLHLDSIPCATSGASVWDFPAAPAGGRVRLDFRLRTLNPKNPNFINRDRIVFSGGHASSLVYSMLHLWGFDVSLEDLKKFRQLGSKTPGHPEFGHTAGVEVTTGPLGQGVANAVGFAMAKKFLSNKFPEINHKVYCLCGDGDLEEGISYEACSLAGKHQLNDLVIIYDDNSISIEGNVKIAFNEDVKKKI
jgi:transketolase